MDVCDGGTLQGSKPVATNRVSGDATGTQKVVGGLLGDPASQRMDHLDSSHRPHRPNGTTRPAQHAAAAPPPSGVADPYSTYAPVRPPPFHPQPWPYAAPPKFSDTAERQPLVPSNAHMVPQMYHAWDSRMNGAMPDAHSPMMAYQFTSMIASAAAGGAAAAIQHHMQSAGVSCTPADYNNAFMAAAHAAGRFAVQRAAELHPALAGRPFGASGFMGFPPVDDMDPRSRYRSGPFGGMINASSGQMIGFPDYAGQAPSSRPVESDSAAANRIDLPPGSQAGAAARDAAGKPQNSATPMQPDGSGGAGKDAPGQGWALWDNKGMHAGFPMPHQRGDSMLTPYEEALIMRIQKYARLMGEKGRAILQQSLYDMSQQYAGSFSAGGMPPTAPNVVSQPNASQAGASYQTPGIPMPAPQHPTWTGAVPADDGGARPLTMPVSEAGNTGVKRPAPDNGGGGFGLGVPNEPDAAWQLTSSRPQQAYNGGTQMDERWGGGPWGPNGFGANVMSGGPGGGPGGANPMQGMANSGMNASGGAGFSNPRSTGGIGGMESNMDVDGGLSMGNGQQGGGDHTGNAMPSARDQTMNNVQREPDKGSSDRLPDPWLPHMGSGWQGGSHGLDLLPLGDGLRSSQQWQDAADMLQMAAPTSSGHPSNHHNGDMDSGRGLTNQQASAQQDEVRRSAPSVATSERNDTDSKMNELENLLENGIDDDITMQVTMEAGLPLENVAVADSILMGLWQGDDLSMDEGRTHGDDLASASGRSLGGIGSQWSTGNGDPDSRWINDHLMSIIESEKAPSGKDRKGKGSRASKEG